MAGRRHGVPEDRRHPSDAEEIAMSHLTTCYGPEVEAVADLAGDLGPFSSTNFANFNLRQWLDVAGTLGFGPALVAAVDQLRNQRDGLLALTPTALYTFDRWFNALPRASSATVPLAVRTARAKARHDVLFTYAAARRTRGWFIDERASDLAGGASFSPEGTTLSGRAFYNDVASSFLHPHRITDEAPVGAWQSRVLLSLGTFPWVYGTRLYASAPALAWEPAGGWSPALTGMALCADMWQPDTNLVQDAREVVVRYQHFRKTCDEALRDVPNYDARIAIPGRLYREGLLLRADQTSLSVITLSTPLGPLNAVAYNYVTRRFAAFFALRRALLAAPRLGPELVVSIAKNPDPCLASFAPKSVVFPAVTTLGVKS
ncbi:hypothetical protein [Nannocystis pusilla]|uniref:Uncharacterized protein n=1 Tax=Nannocystis pusilla TaxID=889268 RepID=A0ABS7TN51_9BACT|nr:hypothetical protein [Nannocystis pusilla]MBZ5709657.1 hypothetical protein [Nannocystis pusilla]